jgi:hypothetical protein
MCAEFVSGFALWAPASALEIPIRPKSTVPQGSVKFAGSCSRETLAVAPIRRRDARAIHAACRGTHCCGRRKSEPRRSGLYDRTVLGRPPASDGRHAQGRRAAGMVGLGSARACLCSRIISRFFFLFKWNILDATKGQTAAEFSAAFFFACQKTATVGRAASLPFLVSRRGARRQAGSLPYAGFQGPLAARVAGLRVTAILAFFGVHPKKVRLVRAVTGSRLGVAVPKLSLGHQQLDVSRSPNGDSEHRVFEQGTRDRIRERC